MFELYLEKRYRDLKMKVSFIVPTRPHDFGNDIVKKQFERQEMLKNAPHEEYGFFRVPKIGE